MGFAMGINAVMHAAEEVSYGVTPSTGFRRLPFVSHSMGEERPLIEDDQLGFGRQGLDPSYDVATNDGDIVVPVDLEAIGFWLKGFFGQPSVVGDGPYTHLFQSGAPVLPSRSIEIGNPDVPSYSVNYGAVVNQLRIAMTRSGMLNCTVSLIAQGETAPVATSVAGVPAEQRGPRFEQASGVIKRDGVTLGNIVSADISLSNSLDKIDVMRGDDGRIGGVVPGVVQAQLRLTARFNSIDLLTAATDGTPIALTEIGWSRAGGGLRFEMPRVFLPRTKRPISGPAGITADFNCQAAKFPGGFKVIARLVNGVSSY